jgi:hypothetical protein
MRPGCSCIADIDLDCNPNLLTLSVENDSSTLLDLTHLLSGNVTPKLKQVTLWFRRYDFSPVQEGDDWLEIDHILNGRASVRLLEIVVAADLTPRPTFIERFPLLWARGMLKITYLPVDQWPK